MGERTFAPGDFERGQKRLLLNGFQNHNFKWALLVLSTICATKKRQNPSLEITVTNVEVKNRSRLLNRAKEGFNMQYSPKSVLGICV